MERTPSPTMSEICQRPCKRRLQYLGSAVRRTTWADPLRCEYQDHGRSPDSVGHLRSKPRKGSGHIPPPIRGCVMRAIGRARIGTPSSVSAPLLGQLDILVNNAGMVQGGSVLTVQRADWDAVLETNLVCA